MSTVDRLRSRVAHAADNIKKQHVVSRVILKRFAARAPHKRQGNIEIIDLEHVQSKSTYRGPGGCGFIDNFVRYASRSLETVWQSVETKMGEAICACEDHSIFSRPDLVKVLKDAIALHFVRSVHSREAVDQAWRKNLSSLWFYVVNERPQMLVDEFKRTRGIYPAGLEALKVVFEDAIEPWQKLRDDDALFRDSLERLFTLACKKLESVGLEVSHPGGGEFVIGDAPAAAIAEDGRIGVLQGVAIGSAATVALPLGPRLMVSTGPKNCFLTLAQEHVDKMITWQVRAASRYVYVRPGSHQGEVVREIARDTR